MKKNILIAVVVIILIAIFVSGGKKQTDTIKIGGAFIMTGPQALIGELQRNAATLAVDEVNATGGINGKTVELIIEDTSYDSKQAVSAYQALKFKDIRYLVADGSPVVAAIRKLVVDDGNFIIAPGATTPVYFDGSNLSCRIALTAKNFGPGFSELLGKKGYMKVATLLPDNEYGRGLADEFTKAFNVTGGKIVVSEFYNTAPTAGDYRTNLIKIKAYKSQIDAVVLVQVSNTIEPMLKQVREIGLGKPIMSDYYTVKNPSLKDLSLANGIDFVDYEYLSTPVVDDGVLTAKFKLDYKNKYGSDPVFLVAGHYDATRLVMEAIREVGDNPQRVADYISSLKDYKAVTGILSFNSDCEVDRQTVFRQVRDGKVVDLGI